MVMATCEFTRLKPKLLGLGCGCGSRLRVLHNLNYKTWEYGSKYDTSAEIQLKQIKYLKKEL